MRDFKKFVVWKKAHLLCLEVYGITNDFSVEEKYGLISQIRRAFSSMPTNIVEGCGYETQKEFTRFLRFTSGSSSEVEYQLLLSKDLNFISGKTFNTLNNKVIIIKKVLYKLTKSIS